MVGIFLKLVENFQWDLENWGRCHKGVKRVEVKKLFEEREFHRSLREVITNPNFLSPPENFQSVGVMLKHVLCLHFLVCFMTDQKLFFVCFCDHLGTLLCAISPSVGIIPQLLFRTHPLHSRHCVVCKRAAFLRRRDRWWWAPRSSPTSCRRGPAFRWRRCPRPKGRPCSTWRSSSMSASSGRTRLCPSNCLNIG